MFKKVIGQDLSDPSRQAQATPPAPVILRHTDAQQPAAQQPAQPALSRPPAGSTRNILSTDVEIKGTIKFTNDLLVDGKIEGEIASDGNLTVGENARIKAEIKTATVVVYGKVQGNITATDRIELKSSAEVIGDIKTKTLSIEAGAIFVGRSTVGTPAQVVATPAASAAPAKPATPAEPPKQATLPGAV